MKKNIFIVIMCMCVLCTYAQTKKATATKKTTVTNKKAPTKKEKTDDELAIEKAQIWFKDKYVETMFKDPYSYRVVGIKALPVTYGDWLDKQASKVRKIMKECNVSESDNPDKSLADIKKLIEDCEKEMSRSNSTTSYNKFKKIRDDCKQMKQDVEKYIAYREELYKILRTSNEMSVEELKTFVFFDIHLDCYSKNDLGNEVLGRFVFPFTKDGVFKDDKTTLQMVEIIN